MSRILEDPPVQERAGRPRLGISRRSPTSVERGPGEPERRGGWIVRIVVGVICLMWVVPTIGVFITSFRSIDDSNTSGWWSVLTSPTSLTRLTLKNYSDALNGPADIGQAFVNSFAITLPATIIPIMVAAFAAYAFTFMEFKGRDTLSILIVSLLVVPSQVAYLPLLKLYGQLGINGTFTAVWLAHMGFGMSLAIFLLRNYMATLPREVIESGRVDGASHFQTFWKLVVPMSVPALASFAIFQFLWVWNDLLTALVFIGGGPNQPLPLAVNSLLGQQARAGSCLPRAAS